MIKDSVIQVADWGDNDNCPQSKINRSRLFKPQKIKQERRISKAKFSLPNSLHQEGFLFWQDWQQAPDCLTGYEHLRFNTCD